MNRSYELVNDLIDMFKNSGSLCLDVTYKDNNIYMNTIKYNQMITSTPETIMNENMKLLKDVPDVLFLINSSINKTSYINSDQRVVNNCLWFNVIKNLNSESGYEITYDDVKNFKETINFNGHTYKIAHCMVFDGYNPRFKILNYKDNQKYLYSDYIDNKEELSKIFRGENQNKFSVVNGTIDPTDSESYVPVYIRTTPKSSVGTFNFPLSKPLTFGTTTPVTGTFNFPAPAKPLTFGSTTPTTGSFNFPAPAKPLTTFGTPATPTFGTATPTTGSFNFPAPAKPPTTFGTPATPTFGTATPTTGSFNFPTPATPTFGTATPTTGSFNFPAPAKPPTFGTPATPTTGSFNFPAPAKPPTFGTTTPATGSFNFPAPAKPPTFGTTTPTTGSFNFPAPVKPPTFGTTTPATGSFNFPAPAKPPTFGTTTTPATGMFNLPPIKPQKGVKAKSNRKKKMLKKTIKKARIVKIKIIKKK